MAVFFRETLPPLRDVIRDHDLRAEKKFGQNFLLDQNLTDKIVRQAGSLSGVHAIEIGPGPGGLTRSLLCSEVLSVTAIEFDPRAVAALESLTLAAAGRLRIIEGDALKIDCKSLTPSPRVIVANLPYNIATPLLIGWMKDIYHDPQNYRGLTLMFQKEVGQRITAQCGEDAYGRLGILVQWLCDAQYCFDVPASAFTPPPKVTSGIVTLTPKKQRHYNPRFSTMEKLTAAAFGQRRKMIRSSLKSYAALFEDLNLDPTSRAETLAVDDFLRLALAIEEKSL